MTAVGAGEGSETVALLDADDLREQEGCYYTPTRIRFLLRLYLYLGMVAPPMNPELLEYVQHAFGPSGWREEALARRGDIGRALDDLTNPCRMIVWHRYVQDRTLQQVVTMLPGPTSTSTVSRYAHHGLYRMAISLGWSGPYPWRD